MHKVLSIEVLRNRDVLTLIAFYRHDIEGDGECYFAESGKLNGNANQLLGELIEKLARHIKGETESIQL